MLLKGEGGVKWEDAAFLNHHTYTRAGVFTKELELAFVNDGDSILYDRIKDPNQTRNLYFDKDYKEIVSSLGRRAIEHNIELSSPAAGRLQNIELNA